MRKERTDNASKHTAVLAIEFFMRAEERKIGNQLTA
jgi:hypothetical protein